MEPAVLLAKEGLALSNGTSLMAGLLSLAVIDAAMLCETADVVGAMSLEALQGVTAAFDPRIHAARGQRGQITSAARIRSYVEGSHGNDAREENGHGGDAFHDGQRTLLDRIPGANATRS